jgi:hypothetical protein
MPTQIRIDNLTVNSDAPDLQSVIDRAVAQIRTDSDKATKAEKERADALTASLKHVKANAISRGTIVRSLTAKLDAMKAKMIGCDECGGSGKVDAGEGAELAKCDYCDGVGSLRMHDAIKAAPVANDAEEENLEMDDAEEPEMVDDASLERDDPEEEKVEKVANPEHKDAKKRADARKAAQKRRADSIVRMVNRAAKARAALLTEATSHLGADAKLDGKGNEEIEREVVAKLAPHVKLDGLSAREVGVLFASETGRVAKARKDGQMSASDIARAGLMPVPMMTANRADADLQKKIDAANHAKYHSHEPKSAK